MVTAELLAQYRIFDNLPEKIGDAIQEQAEIAPYAPGEVIVPAGQPFTFFGVILEGEAEAYLPEQDGESRSIETIKAGGSVGEMGLLTGQSAPVDVIATAPCRV